MFASFSTLHNYNYIGIRFVVCDKKCTHIEDKYIFYETIILLRFYVANRILCDFFFSNLTKIMFHLSIPTLSYVSTGGTYFKYIPQIHIRYLQVDHNHDELGY